MKNKDAETSQGRVKEVKKEKSETSYYLSLLFIKLRFCGQGTGLTDQNINQVCDFDKLQKIISKASDSKL